MRPWLLLSLILLAPTAWAQDPPACTLAREGMVACFVEKLCECRFDQGGQLTGRPSAHRWDCGILRPNCGPAPASVAPSQSLPQGLILPVPRHGGADHAPPGWPEQRALPPIAGPPSGENAWGAARPGTR